MPIAAVPEYIGKQDLSKASPGMRFTLYLPIWTERADQEKQVRKMASAKSSQGLELKKILESEGMDAAIAYAQAHRGRFPKLWEKNDHGAKDAWGLVSRLEKADTNCMAALVARQRAMAQAGIQSGELLVIEGVSTAPFTTGLGNEHPLENGFAFLWPYGLPYLPGSGVKGVLRQAARELASGEWGDSRGWSADKDIEVSLEKETLRISMLDALFGLESEDGGKQHLRGALTFWDVVPQIEGKRLMLEVMTPHQGHYYQQKKERKTGDSITPHDSGQPVPIYFLTVPPGSGFTFHVRCDLPFLQRIAPDLAEGGRWKSLLQAAFEHAFDWLGFGAKTAVGYGAMQRRTTAETGPQSASPAETAIWSGATLSFKPNTGEVTASRNGERTAPLRGTDLAERLPAELLRRLKRKKTLRNVTVRVQRTGNLIELVGVDG